MGFKTWGLSAEGVASGVGVVGLLLVLAVWFFNARWQRDTQALRAAQRHVDTHRK
jgi:hypothetical protein